MKAYAHIVTNGERGSVIRTIKRTGFMRGVSLLHTDALDDHVSIMVVLMGPTMALLEREIRILERNRWVEKIQSIYFTEESPRGNSGG